MIVYVVVASDHSITWIDEVFESQVDAEEYRKYKEINYSNCGFNYEVNIMTVHRQGERFWE